MPKISEKGIEIIIICDSCYSKFFLIHKKPRIKINSIERRNWFTRKIFDKQEDKWCFKEEVKRNAKLH